MIASFLPMLIAFALLGAASRRPADQLGLTRRQRRQVKGLAALLLLLSFTAGVAVGGSLLDCIAWVMAAAMIVPPVALGLMLLARRR